MNRIIISLTSLAAFAVAFSSPTMAEAKPSGHPAIHAPAAHFAPVHHVNGYHYGNYHFTRYHLRDYRGWSRWTWNARFGCYYYLSPTDNCWYYWYAPSQCYLPVDSIATYPPIASPMLPPAQLPTTAPYPPGF